MTRLTVLGCSGGIGGPDQRTTSLLVDDDILIDAGSGVGQLDIAQLTAIDHVFVTHAHLDHIAFLPFLVDTVGEARSKPVTVYALEATRRALQAHVFNWEIWPDFTVLPDAANPFLRFETVSLGQTIVLGGRAVTVLPAHHAVPAVGYAISSGQGSLVFTGDTTVNDALWEQVNAIPDLRYLLIETAFPDRELALAIDSKHLCPSLLATELAKLTGNPEVFLTHLKPTRVDQIIAEVGQSAAAAAAATAAAAAAAAPSTVQPACRTTPVHAPQRLQNGQQFHF